MWGSLFQGRSVPCHPSPDSDLLGLQGGSEICIFNRHLGVVQMQGVCGPPLEKHCFWKKILNSRISEEMDKLTVIYNAWLLGLGNESKRRASVLGGRRKWIDFIKMPAWIASKICYSHIHQWQLLMPSLCLLSSFQYCPFHNWTKKGDTFVCVKNPQCFPQRHGVHEKQNK